MRLFARKVVVLLRKMGEDDVDSVRAVGQSAWSDLYSKEFHQNFQVPKRSARNVAFSTLMLPVSAFIFPLDSSRIATTALTARSAT